MSRHGLSVICQSGEREEKREFENARICSENLARPAGLEPATFGSGGRRSIQLSYGRELRRLTTALARPEGVEPPAYRFEACRSIQLSYGR